MYKLEVKFTSYNSSMHLDYVMLSYVKSIKFPEIHLEKNHKKLN